MIPVIALNYYSRPCVDDFWYSYPVKNVIDENSLNILNIISTAVDVDIHFYQTWQGLYSSAFILALQPGIFGERLYGIGGVMLLFFCLVCVWYLIKTLFTINGIKHNYIIATLAIFCYLFQFLPSPLEGIYWYNGAYNYVPFFFAILVNITFILNICIGKNVKKYTILSAVLSFVISGGNHVTSFLNIMILCFLLLYAAFYSRNKKANILISLISAVVGFVIMYKAPGTAVRQAMHTPSGVIETLIQSANHAVVLTFEWINLQWILLMTIVAFTTYKYARKYQLIANVHPAIVIISTITLFCGILCVPFYAIHTFGAGRVTNIFWWTFISLSVFLVSYFTLYFRDVLFKEQVNQYSHRLIYKFLILSSVCIFIDSKSLFRRSLGEIRNGTASAFAYSFDKRLKEMNQADKKTLLVLEPIVFSDLLKFDDLRNDFDDWRNVAWYNYYHIKCIVKE